MVIKRTINAFFAWGVVFAALSSAQPMVATMPPGEHYYMYVGTYTGPKSKGIYAFRYDTKRVSFEPLGLVGEMERPSFLAIHPNGRFLYAVSELGNDGHTNGFVYSFAIDPITGKLTFINKRSSGGGGACHLVVDKTQQILLVANYGSGSVAAFRLAPDGSIGESTAVMQFSGSGPNPQRQRGPHAHAVVLSPDNRFLFVPDLGTDQIHILKFDPVKGSLALNEPPYAKVDPGAGPRHLTFAPDGRFAYVVDEMGSTVTAFNYEAGLGALTELQVVSTLSDEFTGINNAAEIQTDPAGHYLYASNRGNDSIAVFSIEKNSGKLVRIQIAPTQGRTPRNFTIDPTGKYLLAANQDTDNIIVFRMNHRSGKLTPAGKMLAAPSPVCLTFVSAP
ncbi:MAG TPA: lactonase family protein [Bryobacteraceae bacterium]|nr:lactonase family protein [Bryobacteraceae bacterium]